MLGDNYGGGIDVNLRGIDTLEFALEVDNYLELFKVLQPTLSQLKEKARVSGSEGEIELGGVTLRVERKGIPFYSYWLSCKDFFVYFTDGEVRSVAPVKVKFLAGYLWSYGAKKAYELFIDWINRIGLLIVESKVSRVDLCLDSDEIEFGAGDLDRMVTLARDKAAHGEFDEFTHGKRVSGFTIGKGQPLLARIYNKSVEVVAHSKLWFYQVWLEAGWKGEGEVWRVEFQLRRPLLIELQVSAVEELWEKEEGIWDYLTNKWLTHRNPEGANVSRWMVSQKWEAVQLAGRDHIGSPAIREKVKRGHLDRLMNQGAGIILSAAALADSAGLEDILEWFKSWIEVGLEKKCTTFDKIKSERQRKFVNFGPGKRYRAGR